MARPALPALRGRFPGLHDGWARLDGPAGTQMVDAAIDAMADFMRSGENTNHGGLFAAAEATDAIGRPATPSAGCSAATPTASPSGRA